MKRVFSVFLAAVMTLSLASCGGESAKTMEDVVDAYKAHEDAGNYALAGTMNMDIKMSSEGLDLEMPMTVDVDMTVTGDKSHGTAGLSASMMGIDMSEAYEFYTDGELTFMCEDGEWGLGSEDNDAMDAANMSQALASEELFKKAELTENRETGGWTAVITGDALAGSGLMDNMLDLSTVEDDAELKESMAADLAKGKIIYEFDKDCYLTSIRMEDMNFSETVTEDGVESTVELSLRLNFTLSGYGSQEEIVVPEEIMALAADTVSEDGGDYDWLEGIAAGGKNTIGELGE